MPMTKRARLPGPRAREVAPKLRMIGDGSLEGNTIRAEQCAAEPKGKLTC